ncbi:MAG: zinc-dependent metalloprotease [Saprospiraceae bacterium]
MLKYLRPTPSMFGIWSVVILSQFIFSHTFGQLPIRPVFCGNEVFSNILKEKYPDLFNAFNETFEDTRTATSKRANDPLDVNVVVHVVWNALKENLDDSIIYNQIDILNKDYNRLNADSSNLRSLFKPEAGNANIHFHLAGIVRVHTNVLFNVDLLGTNLLAEAKHTSDGGSDAWNPVDYLNIWVCNIQPIKFLGVTIGQILGFAFPPNNLQNWPAQSGAPTAGEDGVAIDFRVFGSNNPNPIANPDGSGDIVVKGRTTVHEVGHYFGLRHIWGDGGLLGANDCAQSDGVDDTPFANAQSAFDCDTTKNTCTQIEPYYNRDVPDLIENYMDYASEACMNMFTHGQVALMRNSLQGPRSGLLVPFVATKDMKEITHLSISPNPSSGLFSIELDLKESTELSMNVLNLSGQVVKRMPSIHYEAGDQKIEMDVAGLSSGVYVIQLKTSDGLRCEKLTIH